MDAVRKYKYVKVGRPYFCDPQNRLALFWYLIVRYKSLRLGSLSLTGRRLVGRRALLRHIAKGTPNGAKLEMPVRGTFCLPVHRGHKVFNLPKRSVIKVFDDDVPQQLIDTEIENVGTASRLDFAPNVHGWSREERWYEEDYVVGGLECQKPMTSSEFLANYDSQIADVLEKTILLQDPNVVSLPEYVDDVLETARSPRLDAANLKKGHVSRIREFMETTANRLRSQRHRQIYLVFSHGDFSQQNVMRTKRGVRCIDWESARRRSILYDLYNYFFTELHYERTQSNMVSEIPDAVRSMQARLLTKAPSLSQGLTDAALIYLRTYYIERVQTFLERELSNQLLTVVLQSISAFQQYDRELEEVGGWNELNAAGNAEAAR